MKTEDQLKQQILAYIQGNNTMTIATINNLGKPEAAAVFYVNKDFQLYFLSDPNSRHSANIGNGADCAVTIQKDYKTWQDIQGLQLEGQVIPVLKPRDKAQILKKYAEKYSFLNQLSVGHKIVSALAKAGVYHFSPHKIWLTDNSHSFGQRQELIL